MITALAALLVAASAPEAPRFSPRPNRAGEISWSPWGEAPFARARATKRPVLLSLSAVWCHWCHVMDETTLSDPRVIAALNEGAIPVRVDADQHPDVERRYLLGGWPTVAFLDADGRLLGGGTYVAPDAFLAMIAQARDLAPFGDARPSSDVDEAAPATTPLAEGAAAVVRSVQASVDRERGGFGRGQKFPDEDAVQLLLEHEPAAALLTLRAFARGETFDDAEGGFYRYATRPDFTEPHYEKMLVVNAELARDCAASGDPALALAAQATLGYLRTTLFDAASGALWPSQDADEAYSRSPREARARLVPPRVDRTSLADRTGLAAAALFDAASALGDPAVADLARAATDHLLAAHALAGGGFAHVPGGDALLLGDQAGALAALTRAYEWTGGPRYLDAALATEAAMERSLAAPSGGWYDAPARPSAPGLLRERGRPLVDNARAAEELLRLAALTDEEPLAERARRALQAFAGAAPRLGTQGARWALAAELAGRGPLVLAVVGPAKDLRTRALRGVAERFPSLRKLVRPVDPASRKTRFPGGAPALYACLGKACSSPLRDPAEAPAALAAFVARQGVR